MTPRLTAVLLPILVLAGAEWCPGQVAGTVAAALALQPGTPSVRDRVARLDSDDPREVSRTRAELLRPLENAKVDARFAYSQELVPELSALAGRTKRDATVINILMIAGEVATDQAADLVERFRADQRTAVRFAAVRGFRRTFDASVAAEQVALTLDRANAIVDALGGQIVTEPSPEVLDAIVRTLASAAEVGALAGLRDRAIGSLAEQVGARVKKLAAERQPPELKAALRAGGVVRDALIDRVRPLRDETKTRAGELAGHLLAHVVVRLRAGDYPLLNTADTPEQQEAARAARKMAAELVGVSETIISLAAQGLPELNLAAAFREATPPSDQRVLLESVRLLDQLRQKYMRPDGFFIQPG